MRPTIAHRSRLPVILAVAATLLSATAARGGTITYTAPTTIFPFVAPICVPPLTCGDLPSGTYTPSDLNPYLDQSAQGIVVTGLTLTYSADPADDGKDITLRWHGSRPFDVSGSPPYDFANSSHLDGTAVFDPTKFSVTLGLQTNFLDISAPATLEISVQSGVSFNSTAAGTPTTLPPGPYTLTNFFALTFTQTNATATDTITLNLPGSLISTVVPAGVGPPVSKDDCKGDGWRRFDVPRKFKNQGDCIQFVNTGR